MMQRRTINIVKIDYTVEAGRGHKVPLRVEEKKKIYRVTQPDVSPCT